MVTGHINLLLGCCYIIAQLSGACVAILLVVRFLSAQRLCWILVQHLQPSCLAGCLADAIASLPLV